MSAGTNVLTNSEIADGKHWLPVWSAIHGHIDDLVQDCNNCIAYALELLQPCIKLSIYSRTKGVYR